MHKEIQLNSAPEVNLSQAVLPPRVYHNPIPVAVAVVPVLGVDPADGIEKIGLLAVRRGIPPKIGELVLPGGFMEEDWREALRRELFEETDFLLPANTTITPFDVQSVEPANVLIVFGKTDLVDARSLPRFNPTNETTERVILYAPQELAFSTHTDVMKRFFEELPGMTPSLLRSANTLLHLQ